MMLTRQPRRPQKKGRNEQNEPYGMENLKRSAKPDQSKAAHGIICSEIMIGWSQKGAAAWEHLKPDQKRGIPTS